MSEPATTHPEAGTLEAAKRWSHLEACTCPWVVRGGHLYGVPTGKTWVRLNTEPTCPIHGEEN